MSSKKRTTTGEKPYKFRALVFLMLFAFLFIGGVYYSRINVTRGCVWNVVDRDQSSEDDLIFVWLDKTMRLWVDRHDQKVCRRVNMATALHRQVMMVAKRLIKPGQCVVDIGAGYGENTLRFSRLVGTQGNVYAFEVDDQKAYQIKRSLTLNNITHVQVLNRGISEKDFIAARVHEPSKKPLIVGDTKRERTCAKSRCALVQMQMLDTVLPKATVDFLFVDVHTYQAAILKGAAQVLASNPQITVMLHWNPKQNAHHQENIDELIAFFHYEKFNLWHVDERVGLVRGKLETLFDKRAAYVVLSRKRAL